jgi:hypothetical protein
MVDHKDSLSPPRKSGSRAETPRHIKAGVEPTVPPVVSLSAIRALLGAHEAAAAERFEETFAQWLLARAENTTSAIDGGGDEAEASAARALGALPVARPSDVFLKLECLSVYVAARGDSRELVLLGGLTADLRRLLPSA